MEEIQVKDYLRFGELKDIKKIIGNEKLLYSDRIVKINKYNMSKERNIIITDASVYNLKKKSKKNSKFNTLFYYSAEKQVCVRTNNRYYCQ